MSEQYIHKERPPGVADDNSKQEIGRLRQHIDSLQSFIDEQGQELKRLKKELTKIKDNINIINVTLRNKR